LARFFAILPVPGFQSVWFGEHLLKANLVFLGGRNVLDVNHALFNAERFFGPLVGVLHPYRGNRKLQKSLLLPTLLWAFRIIRKYKKLSKNSRLAISWNCTQ
jgi:hypothetical protein